MVKFPHSPILCIQFLNRENNDKNNTFPLGKQICCTIVWGCAETLPICDATYKILLNTSLVNRRARVCLNRGDINKCIIRRVFNTCSEIRDRFFWKIS